ncbi:MAG: S8 family serine peptidase [Anaerolineae bacterium]|nr:S8 family serine peptidase [Anaerolineae bacterium]
MQRKIFYTMLVLVLTLSLSTPALAQDSAAQGEAKSYIVVLQGAPVATYDGSIAGFGATRAGEGAKIAPNSANVVEYRNFLASEHNKSLEAAGVSTSAKVHDYTVALNGYSAILTQEQVDALKSQKGVLLVLEDQMRFPDTDSSPTFLGLNVTGGAYASGITGEGVVVGIIDTGIWPEHPSFADDGSYSSPPTGPLPCEFGNTAWNPDDVAFTCNNKLIGAYQFLATYRALIGADPDEFDSARDDNGHGTHTASTAAGNAGVDATMYGLPVGTISGIAPRAHVIAYKGLGNLGGFTSDLAAAIDQAVADGVDVINYSIGSGPGTPGGDEIAFLFAADAGVFVAASAGNSGSGPGTIGNPATMPWLTSVGASTQSRFFRGKVKLGNGVNYIGASITPGIEDWTPLVDAASAGGDLCVPGSLNPAVVAGKIVLCRRGAVGRAAKSLAVLQAGGVGMIMYENTNDNNLFSDSHWVPSVHIDNTPGLAVKAYIASTANPTARLEANDEDGPETSNWNPAPSITLFSSRGPNAFAADIIKPDVTAPGIQILAGNSPFPDPGTTPPGELFQAIAGTSMSSPHVAGIFALLKQAHPDWSAAMAKSALMTTAHQKVKDNDRVSNADPFDMGAGHVRPGGKWIKGSITQPGLVYDAGLFEYFGFLCDAFPAIFVDPAGTCAFLESLGIPTQAENLNYPSIGIAQVPGSATVTRTVTSVAVSGGKVTYRAKVQAPPGYTVSVSPSTLKLAPGESATFSVTITNVSAPLDVWRFGSLTWKSDPYTVYSPIAVKGVLFQGPAEVSGSYNVSFGYTGPFSAAARGLVPATTFNHAVNTGDFICDSVSIPAGTTYARFALFDANTSPAGDIDLLVFRGATLVGQSLGGTSQEVVNLLNPVAGTYDACLDGFATSNPSNTTLFTWVLGSTAAGNMTVSAPASATIGTSGTINLTFSGLVSGTKYLGSVAYSGVAGLPNPTIVRVDP